MLINHYVKAQNLKAHGVGGVLWLRDLVHVVHERVAGDDCFDHYLLDFVHNLIWVAAILVNDLENGPEAALVASLLLILVVIVVIVAVLFLIVVLLPFVVLLELLIIFVDAVVRQMNVHVCHIAVRGLLVRLSGESSQTLLVDVNAQGI